ncbi:MAG TPA: lytic murein transglycosylase, partial [Xanthobacteraceae bacterium]|nr:lytic murein transglycosylase [Xanthobacteraceae bacterium]
MRKRLIGAAALCLLAAPASAASCHNTGNFEIWLSAYRKEALAQGISQRTLAAAAPYMVYDKRIVGIDRGQRVFNKTFLEFS